MILIDTNIHAINPIYTTDFIQNLQNQVDRKIAIQINKLRASQKNDLGLCFNEEAAWRLGVYYNILENIKYCDSCFKEMEVENIINLVKRNITALNG